VPEVAVREVDGRDRLGSRGTGVVPMCSGRSDRRFRCRRVVGGSFLVGIWDRNVVRDGNG